MPAASGWKSNGPKRTGWKSRHGTCGTSQATLRGAKFTTRFTKAGATNCTADLRADFVTYVVALPSATFSQKRLIGKVRKRAESHGISCPLCEFSVSFPVRFPVQVYLFFFFICFFWFPCLFFDSPCSGQFGRATEFCTLKLFGDDLSVIEHRWTSLNFKFLKPTGESKQ